MSKALWWVAGAVGLAWLASQDGSSRSAPSYPAGSGYSLPTNAGVPGRFGAAEGDSEADEHAEEVRQAKQDLQDAADELRSAVDDLRHNRWSVQMSTIRDRLEDADDALSQLEGLRPADPAVQNARDELDTMRSHITRLHHENWRSVRPDLDSSASAIEDEAGAVSEDAED